MLRILRRYNKWILVIGGSLLMMAFLIPEAIQSLSQRSAVTGSTWARTNDGDVTGADEIRLRDEMRVVGFLGDSTLSLPGFSRDPVHWYLLQHEAVRAGLVGGPSDGFALLQQIEQAQPEGFDAERMLQEIAVQAQVPTALVYETLAKLNGVNRLIALYERSARLSDRRIRAAASEMLATVDADMVVVDARRLSESSDYTPSEEELAEHLAEYGDTMPGSPPFGFGYRQPDRVRIEWITVSAASIRRSVETSDRLSNIELRKHRDRNMELFPTVGVETGDDFERVRPQVREHLLGLLATQRSDEIAKFMADQMALPQRGLPRDGPFVALPGDWSDRRSKMDELAAAVAEQFKIELPIYRTSGPTMIEPARIESLPDLASATTDRVGATPMRPAQLVAEARELDGSDIFAVQTGVALPIFRSPSGDLILVRILDADKSRPPHSVDEVRDKLIADLRALRSYEELLSRLDSIRADAIRDGLVPLARSFDTTVQSMPRLRGADPQFLQFGFRMTPSLPGLGQAEDALGQIMTAALSLPLDVPISSLSDDVRTIAFGVDSRLSAAVVRITGLTPLTQEEFEPLREQGVIDRTLLGEDIRELRLRLFSKAAMIERNGFHMLRETPEEEEWDEASSSAP